MGGGAAVGSARQLCFTGSMAKQGQIRVGIGGWTFEPWRGGFYPKGLPHARELEYASQRLASIEINGTFYRTQTPASYAKWRAETPEGFVFSVKGPRYAVNRSVLREAGDSIKRFLDSGVTELGSRLGPILWQFAGHKKFDEADFGRLQGPSAGEAGRREAASRGGAAPPLVPDAGIHRAPAQILHPGGLCRACHLSRHSRPGGRLRLRAPAEGAGRHRHRLPS